MPRKRITALNCISVKQPKTVIIDGEMNEAAWQEAETAGNFFMVLPMDTSHAHVNTEVKMTYDKENLYIIAICHLPKNKTALHGRIIAP